MMKVIEAAIVRGTGRWEARRKAKEYKEVAEMTKDRTYIELANVYKYLAMGKKIISMTKAMELAGVHGNGLPVLAIANAHAKWAWYVHDAGRIYDKDGQWNHQACAFVSDYSINPAWNRRSTQATRRDTFRFSRFSVRPNSDKNRARVPIIPPQIRLGLRGEPSNYQILWEADWVQAPKDPLLLRRISRDCYVVMAQWDLTDVERLVLDRAAFEGE